MAIFISRRIWTAALFILTASLAGGADRAQVGNDRGAREERRAPEDQGGVAGESPLDTCCQTPFTIPAVVYYPSPFNTAGSDITCSCDTQFPAGCADVQLNFIWYLFVPPCDGFIRVDTSGSTYDTVLDIFDECGGTLFPNCHGDPTLLACDDDSGTDVDSLINLAIDCGSSYHIRVSRDSGPSGNLDFNFAFSANPEPASNSCLAAEEIPAQSAGFDFDPDPYWTTLAYEDACEPQETCEFLDVGVSNSVWYRFTPVEDGTIDIHTNGSNYDTVLSIFNGCGTCFIQPGQLACNDNGGIGLASQLQNFPVLAGVTYRIKVASHGALPDGGILNFNFSYEPSGCQSDMNGDGEVNGADLGVLLLDWGACN